MLLPIAIGGRFISVDVGISLAMARYLMTTSLSTILPQLALWAGAECTINRVRDDYRDQIACTGHDGRSDDLQRFAGLGIDALRYPLLWEAFAQADDPDRLWAWHDERLARLRALGVRPIVGLVHHGSGPRSTDLLSPDFATGLEDHAAAAAQRYPWIADWTPVNEPLTTARFSALYGHWYPHVRDEKSFWLALLNQVDGICAAMVSIRRSNPVARLIQTEDLGHTGATAERARQAAFDNDRRWASWDMLAGRFTHDHPLWQRLVDFGFEDRLTSLANAPCPPDLLGLNHYLTSDRFLDHRVENHPASTHGSSAFGVFADVEAVRVVDYPPGLEGALRACWERYRTPIALTEVHNGCTREEQMRWLQEAWETATDLRAEGISIEAVTIWSLLGACDWNSLLTRDAGHYESGVFDIRGQHPRETALAPMIRTMAAGGVPEHPVLDIRGWWRRHSARMAPLREQGQGRCGPPPAPLLIAGATGTLGQAFAGACRLRGIAHIVTGRDVMDLRDKRSMAEVLDSDRPWAVINCTGWVRVDDAETHAEDCVAANFVGSVDLANACAQRDIHYCCFSSDLVFDGRSRYPYVESDLTAPLNVYGLSKARADDALQAYGGRTLIVRTSSFFSPFDEQNFAVRLAAALRAGQSFPAADDCITSPTYVPDLVRATIDLIIDDEIGLWHLASQGAASWADFAKDIGMALDLRTDLIEARPANAMGWAARRPRHAALASERGAIMPTLQSGIERFASQFR